jgi:hypothetical protein
MGGLEGIPDEPGKEASAKRRGPPACLAMSKAGLPASGTMRLVSDADRARSASTRSSTPLSNEVASLFGSRTHDLAGQRRAVPSKRSRSHRGVITSLALAIDFPDIARHVEVHRRLRNSLR